MGSKSSRASASETESNASQSETERAPSKETENTGETKADEKQTGGALRYGGSGSSVQQSSSPGGLPTAQRNVDDSVGGYVNYEDPSHGVLSDRYGIDFVKNGQAQKLQRLESDFGPQRVSRWVNEGMTVETMGKPQDMQAFRKRQEHRSGEIPRDVERRNQVSLQRNAGRQNDGLAGETQVPDTVRDVVSSPGQSLEGPVQREMNSKMGGDFSDVQIHAGPQAAAAADQIQARAFTVGNHVAFNRGEYNPESNEGKEVLAHELTHVRQQTDGAVSMLPKADAQLAIEQDSAREREAQQVAREVTDSAGETTSPHATTDSTPEDTDGALTLTHRGTPMHVQPKLEVSSPSDPAEKEAERVAEQVMKMDEPETEQAGESDTEAGSEGIDRKQEEVGLVRTVPIRRSASDGSAVPEESESAVRSAVQGGGKPLPSDTRESLGSKMGADFSDVNVHTGSDADAAARSINAEAFTIGNDIAFAKGNYNPDSTGGKELLAHELTHVVQQGKAPQAHRSVYRQDTQGGGGSQSAGGMEDLGEMDGIGALQGYIVNFIQQFDASELEVTGTIPVATGINIEIGLSGASEKEDDDDAESWELASALSIGGSVNLGFVDVNLSFNGNIYIVTDDLRKFGELFQIMMRESLDSALETSGVTSEGLREWILGFIFDEDDMVRKKEEMAENDEIGIGVGAAAGGEAGSVDDGAGVKGSVGGGRGRKITSEAGSAATETDGYTEFSGDFEVAFGGFSIEIGYEYMKADSDEKGEHEVAIAVPFPERWTPDAVTDKIEDITSQFRDAIIMALQKYDQLASQFEGLPTLGLGDTNVDLDANGTSESAGSADGGMTGAAEIEFTTDPLQIQSFKAELLAVGEVEVNAGVFKVSGSGEKSLVDFSVSF